MAGGRVSRGYNTPMDTPVCPGCLRPLPAPVDAPRCAYAPCGAPFERTDHKQRFCSDNHRLRNHREAKKAKARPASSAPRVLEQAERITRVEARIPAGTKPKDVPPELRTFDMFEDPPPATLAENAVNSPDKSDGLSDANHRLVTEGTRIRWLEEDILRELGRRGTMTFDEMVSLSELPEWCDFKIHVFGEWLNTAEDILRFTGRIVYDSKRDEYSLAQAANTRSRKASKRNLRAQ